MKYFIKKLFAMCGLGIHRSDTIAKLKDEVLRLRSQPSELTNLDETSDTIAKLKDEVLRLRSQASELTNLDQMDGEEIASLRQRAHMGTTDEDYNLEIKRTNIVNNISDFGRADFSELACWLLASSLNDHKIINQRLDETALLWRTTKMSGGRILEVGRAGGGSTVAILGASEGREVISIDRYPQHAEIVDKIFEREDVKNRLTLLTRSSRDEIDVDDFGMLFVDGDHTYEGICHDIAYFWNKLKTVHGKPALAVFHDAAENPIAHVPDVARACNELVAEKNVAKVLESWGSMLLLEKVGDINPSTWHAKEDREFWQTLSNDKNLAQIKPQTQGSLSTSKITKIKVLEEDYMGADNFDDPSWQFTGFSMEPATVFADSPLRVLREDVSTQESSLRKKLKLNKNISQYCLTAHLRPIGIQFVHICLETDGVEVPIFVDLQLDEKYTIINKVSSPHLKVDEVTLNYKNGYFCCEINFTKVSDNLIYDLCIGSGLFSERRGTNNLSKGLIVMNAVSLRGAVEQ